MQPTTTPPTSRRSSRSSYAVLIADTSADARATLQDALVGIKSRLVAHAKDGDELEDLFFNRGPYDLVVCRALLGCRSGLQVLAKARAARRFASFIVYSSLDGPWLRVFVSDAESTVLSSRVVSLEGLAGLAAGMLEANRA